LRRGCGTYFPPGTTLEQAKKMIGPRDGTAQASPAKPEQPPAGAHELHYGIVDPDYARVFTMARVLAWQEGYALAMHGSFTRDLDLIAVPWTERACEPAHLVRRVADATGLGFQREAPHEHPHGRLVWTLLSPAFADPRFVDFGVMPRTAPPAPSQSEAPTASRINQEAP